MDEYPEPEAAEKAPARDEATGGGPMGPIIKTLLEQVRDAVYCEEYR